MGLIENIKNIILFNSFCKKKFKQFSKNNTNNLILIEFNSITDCYLVYSYFSSELAKKFNAKIIGFTSLKDKTIKNIIKFCLIRLNPLSRLNMYRSFGVDDFIHYISLDKFLKDKVDRTYHAITKKIKNKKEFENLKINSVLVGDLFYDSYLKKFLKPTLDFENNEFRKFLYQEIKKFYFWYNLIDKNVKSIVVSHTVYTLAVPLRICVKKNIEAFQVSLQHLYRLNKKEYSAYKEFKTFPKLFAKLPKKEKIEGLKKAKQRLNLRLNGRVGVDMSYSKKSAYGKFNKNIQLLKKNNKIKVLIATHCFYDSPHSFGHNLFPDFYEWLDFLGKMTKKTDYDWYIKTHPDYLPGTMRIIKEFIKKYSRFKLLPSNSSHNQISKEGINTVLTVYGTVGCEYPLLNKLVINASMNNPHIAYKFNRHCKSLKDYEKTIKNLPYLVKNFSINKNKVYEYYYMQHLYKFKDIFYKNLIQSKDDASEYKILGKWEKQISKNKNLEIKIERKIKTFIYNKNYYCKF